MISSLGCSCIVPSGEVTCLSFGLIMEVIYGPEPLEKPADGNLLVYCSQPIRDVVIDVTSLGQLQMFW